MPGRKNIGNAFDRTILPFIHFTIPCYNATSGECCENGEELQELTQGHDENNSALGSSAQQNAEGQQPDEPQNDSTACGGITDINTDILLAELDAQCVESYAMALRFFSYSMGLTDIDTAIVGRPPMNELLEKLRQYQRLVLNMIDRDNRQMEQLRPDYYPGTDLTPELQGPLDLLDEDVHSIAAMVDLVTRKVLIMRQDYPLLFLTAIWCVSSMSRLDCPLPLQRLLHLFENKYTEEQV
ncbi:hypothetical protein TcWFU_004960 [Taenia crassiceps]|uniref:Uncharacterized protein n=1 Tax=Taenia crassiceps TaxID=6207 RepID=A0ABR4Q3T4_9CEST